MRIYEIKLTYSLVQLGEDTLVDRADKVVAYLASAFAENPLQEAFYAIALDRKNRPIGRILISLGNLTATVVSPREVFRPLILASAAACAVAHNHPSGSVDPSPADVQITRQLNEASKLLGIQLLDHVIVGTPEHDPAGKGYYSFREAGLL